MSSTNLLLFFSSLHPSHQLAWSLLNRALRSHTYPLSTFTSHSLAWSPEVFPSRENRPPPKRLFVYFILATFPPLSLVPFESCFALSHPPSIFTSLSLIGLVSSLVPFEFFQMFKTFFGYEICLFRFVGCFHVQHTHIPFLHCRIQVVYSKMTTTI